LTAGLRRQHRVERPRGNRSPIELVHLILHQRDQGRDDDRDARQKHGWELVAQRLAGPCRHHGQHVASAEHGVDDACLALPKVVMAETRAHLAAPIKFSREAPALGLPYSVARSPLRRLAPLRWLARDARSFSREASPLGLPDSVARSPLRRLAPLRWLARDARSFSREASPLGL